MKKLVSVLLLSLILVVSSISAFAVTPGVAAPQQASFTKHAPLSEILISEAVVYEKTFTVTKKGGTVQVGFVSISFPKNFLPASELPRTFTAKVFASGGHGVIEFSPDTENFLKPVHISIGTYKGLLFDEQTEMNTQVKYHPEVIIANHFSRYCWQ